MQRLPDHRTLKLLVDGRKAAAMRDRGATPSDILMVLGCSRARLYRALNSVRLETRDPLLL